MTQKLELVCMIPSHTCLSNDFCMYRRELLQSPAEQLSNGEPSWLILTAVEKIIGELSRREREQNDGAHYRRMLHKLYTYG